MEYGSQPNFPNPGRKNHNPHKGGEQTVFLGGGGVPPAQNRQPGASVSETNPPPPYPVPLTLAPPRFCLQVFRGFSLLLTHRQALAPLGSQSALPSQHT